MSPLEWSNALLWMVVIGQGLMIVAILRHIGLKAAVPATTVVGKRAPQSAMYNLFGEPLALADDGINAQLVFFIRVDCSVCRHMVAALSAQRGPADGPNDVFIVQGDASAVKRMVSDMGIQAKRVVHDSGGHIFSSWGVTATPFVAVVSEHGIVETTAQPNSRDDLERLLAANGRRAAA